MESGLGSVSGSTVVSSGAVVVTSGAVVVSSGAVVVSSGAVVVSSGAVVVSSGAAVVSLGAAVVSSGAAVVSSGAVVVSSGAVVASSGAVVVSVGVLTDSVDSDGSDVSHPVMAPTQVSKTAKNRANSIQVVFFIMSSYHKKRLSILYHFPKPNLLTQKNKKVTLLYQTVAFFLENALPFNKIHLPSHDGTKGIAKPSSPSNPPRSHPAEVSCIKPTRTGRKGFAN